MIHNYEITFDLDTSHENLQRIEQVAGIPADFEKDYIQASSPRQAMRIFRKKHGIKQRIVPTKNFLNNMYALRDSDRPGWYKLYRVVGVKWGKDFESVVRTHAIF